MLECSCSEYMKQKVTQLQAHVDAHEKEVNHSCCLPYNVLERIDAMSSMHINTIIFRKSNEVFHFLPLNFDSDWLSLILCSAC